MSKLNVARVKGGIQIQFNDGRIGFVRLMDAERLAHLILKVAKPC